MPLGAPECRLREDRAAYPLEVSPPTGQAKGWYSALACLVKAPPSEAPRKLRQPAPEKTEKASERVPEMGLSSGCSGGCLRKAA